MMSRSKAAWMFGAIAVLLVVSSIVDSAIYGED